MFVDSEGRAITAGQWHDEKFKAFTDPEMWQAMAPRSMILGGMKEDGEDEPIVPAAPAAAPAAPAVAAVEGSAQAAVPTQA